MSNNTFVIQAYSKSELASLYNRSVDVLMSWLEPFNSLIGEYRGKSYTPKQVQTIVECLGEP